MNFGPSEGSRPRPRRIRRAVTMQSVRVLLRSTVLLAVAGVVLLAVGAAVDAGIADVGRIALLLALLSGLGLGLRRGVRAARRRTQGRRADRSLRPTNPPLEEIAADLRQMLWRHDVFARSTDIRAPAGRVRALENRITQRAVEAARALEVTHPDPPTYGGFNTAQLRRLLCDLRAEGLVLPPEVGLMAPDSRF
jgi:hypothetical protein